MRVLYVDSHQSEDVPPAMEKLAALIPALEVQTVSGTAAALAQIRTAAKYRAIFLSHQLPQNDALALIATVRREREPVAIVAIITEDQRPFFASAFAAGADDVLVLANGGLVAPDETLRRIENRVATLHRHYLRSGSSRKPDVPDAPDPPDAPNAPDAPDEPDAESVEIARMRAVILAEERIRDLTASVRALGDALARQRKTNEELQEAQGFERAMRDRDREELTRLRQALSDERARRVVLEGTLRQTEDRSRAEREALDAQHAAARRQLEEQVATAADRLHQVANDTQALTTHLQNELAARAAERDRLVHNHLFGYAVVTLDGALVRCNESFARMFGFDSVIDAVAASAGSAMPGLTDHAHVVQELQAGVVVDRVESVVRRANGHPFRVLTSAALLTSDAGERTEIERLFVDLDDRTQIEEQLRLARGLEAAGRLAAEMSNEIESLLPSLESVARTADQTRATTLIRELIAFSRRQAKPAGVLSLTDAVRRADPLLRQIVGDAVSFEIRLQDVGAVVAGEDDIEELLSAAVFTAVGSLPYGGTVVLEIRTARSGFEEHTELVVRASGYGVQSALVSASLARLVNRCGGTVRVTDDPARATALHIHLP